MFSCFIFSKALLITRYIEKTIGWALVSLPFCILEFWVTEVLSQGSKWWPPHVWNSTTYYNWFLNIPVSYFSAVNHSLHSSWSSVARVCILLSATPINWKSHWNGATSLTTYTIHTRVSGTNIYNYRFNPMERNCWDGLAGHINH